MTARGGIRRKKLQNEKTLKTERGSTRFHSVENLLSPFGSGCGPEVRQPA